MAEQPPPWEDTERERTWRWVTKQLVEQGFERSHARQLAESGADYREARRMLVELGASHDDVYAILL